MAPHPTPAPSPVAGLPATASSRTVAPGAVVIGNHTQGLGIVRSAGMCGWPAWMVNDGAFGLARFSKYISGYRRLPRGTLARLDQPASAARLLDTLLAIPVGPDSVLFGVNEDITRFIFEHRHQLGAKYRIPEVAYDRIYDKFQFNQILPDPVRIDTRVWSDDWLDLPDADRFVVKGRQGNTFRRLTESKAMPLPRFAAWDRRTLFTHMRPEEVVLQKRVRSDRPVVSYCSFATDGRVYASFMYEKLRQHPDEFGTGTYLHSMDDEALAAVAATILGALSFTGISEIEFIHDPDDGGWHVIEMNPRTWKSIHFATLCGQNLVDAALRQATGRTPDIDRARHTIDRYWADLSTDLPQMLRERRWGGFHRGFHECAWDRADPMPALALWVLFPFLYLERRWSHGPQAALAVTATGLAECTSGFARCL